ncbi:MAG TPA: sigma-70 family RNA polymerase sigma factor [Longimicrobium sp.]|nr:sigma-70 family RNA polymerase sigma factor [Longimicrobium sp.]
MSHHSPVPAAVPVEARPAQSGSTSFAEAREEQLLVQALRERDDAAFELVLDRYYSSMLRTAMIYVGSRARAEEVVQETWLAVLGGIHGFHGRSSLKTWIFRILINRAKTCASREARVVPLSTLRGGQEDAGWGGTPYPADPLDTLAADAGPAFGTGAEGATAEERLLSRELGEHIEAAMATLPARQREVIVLRDVEGCSAREVCNMLGISESNQRVLLHRARVRVRDALEPYLDPA